METKTCCRCKETKPLAEFNLKPQAACKACLNIYQATYRKRNRARKNEAARVRYQEKKDVILAYGAQYRAQNRERLNALQRNYSKREDRLAADRALRAKYKAELTDAYVRRSLVKGTGISVASIPLELMSVKRLQLQILRRVRDDNNT